MAKKRHVLLLIDDEQRSDGMPVEVQVNEKSAGPCLAEPYGFDIGGLLKEGESCVEVKILNTLANHYGSFPTEFVYDGQTVFRLLGPVKPI